MRCARDGWATPGTIAVLHTWSQTLLFHPHLHCIVTGGGLDSTRDRWITARPSFLVPVRVLSKVFRGKLLDLLDRFAATGLGSGGPGVGAAPASAFTGRKSSFDVAIHCERSRESPPAGTTPCLAARGQTRLPARQW